MKTSYSKLSPRNPSPWAYYFQLMERDDGFRESVLTWIAGRQLVQDLGPVYRKDIAALMHGFAPDGAPVLDKKGFIPTPVRGAVRVQKEDRALVSNAEQAGRVPGYDVTISAPKTVSLAWAACLLAGDMERAKSIEKAVVRAADAAIGYLKEADAFRSLGDGGESRGVTEVPIARVLHATSRSGDPQLHAHNVIINVGLDFGHDGAIRGRALASKFILDRLGAAEQLARVSLAEELAKAGFNLLKEGDVVEIAGVPQELRDEASYRRAHALTMAKNRGYGEVVPPSVLDKMLALSRRPKTAVSAEREKAAWEGLFSRQGLNPEGFLSRITGAPRMLSGRAEEVLRNAAKLLEAAVITGPELDEAIFRSATNRLSASRATRLVRDIRGGRRPEFEPFAEFNAKRAPHLHRFTTSEMAKIEREILNAVRNSANDWRPDRGDQIKAAFRKLSEGSAPDMKAAARVATGGSRIALIEGRGYTDILEPILSAYLAAGMRIRRYTESRKKALQLCDDSVRRKIEEKLFADLDGEPNLSPEHVVIVEEAQGLAPRRLHRLVMAAKSAGARVIIAAYTRVMAKRAAREVSPVTGIASIADVCEIDVARLCKGTLGYEPWQIAASSMLNGGDTRGAMLAFAANGAFSGHARERDRVGAILQEYRNAACDGYSHVAITSDDASADRINKALRKTRGLAGGKLLPVAGRLGKIAIAPGERIAFKHEVQLAGARIDKGQIVEVAAVSGEGEEALLKLRADDFQLDARWGDLSGPLSVPDVRYAYALPAYVVEGHRSGSADVVSAVMDEEIGPRVATLMLSRSKLATRAHVLADLGKNIGQIIDKIIVEGGGKTLSSYLRPARIAKWLADGAAEKGRDRAQARKVNSVGGVTASSIQAASRIRSL